MLIDLIAGARPNFVKIAAIIRALEAHKTAGGGLHYRLVHTGQHYDTNMSGSFFEQLSIPEPHVNLEVGSGTQAEQTAAIMTRYESLLLEKPSDLCVVVGDVTSTMATSITAQKLCIPVAHVEGGIRSGDWSMPEEINRMVTDAITNWFFTTSTVANDNLKKSGVDDGQIFFVGNTMIDTLLHNLDRLRPPECWQAHGLEAGKYIVLTLHRPANVDRGDQFSRMLEAILAGARDVPVIFPVHPRTAGILREHWGEKIACEQAPTGGNLKLVEPLPYLEFNYLVKNAMAVITDSGGITEEATVLGIPCLTLRDSTERPETITLGTNELVGTNPDNLAPYLEKLFAGEWKKGAVPEKWDGKTGERIVAHLERLLCP